MIFKIGISCLSNYHKFDFGNLMLCDQTPAFFSKTLFSTCSTSVLVMTYFFIHYAGDLSSVLHTAAKERDSAISRLKQDINTMIKEKEIFQEECAKVIQVRILCNRTCSMIT